MSDHRIELLQTYFFSRTDQIAFHASWNAPQPAATRDLLPALLDGHIRGDLARQ